MNIKYILPLFLLIISFASMRADYYVNNNGGSDSSTGTSSNPFATLGHALNVAEATSAPDVIYLIGEGDYFVTSDSTALYLGLIPLNYRTITSDLTIVGISNTKPTLKWNSDNPYWGNCFLSTHANLNLENLKIDFGAISLINSLVAFDLSSGEIFNCDFLSYPTVPGQDKSTFLFSHNSEDDDLVLATCSFYGIDSHSFSMTQLAYAYSEHSIKINPFRLENEKSYHFFEGDGNTTKIDFGNPSTGDNILLTSNSTDLIPAGTYGEIIVDENVRFATSNSISAKVLHIRDNVTLDASNLTVTDSVHVYGDAFVKSSTGFENASLIVDLAFTPGAYRYFTPPFNIKASDLGDVMNSISLFYYDEEYRARNVGGNAWQQIVDPNADLIKGQGYCIYTNDESVTLKSQIDNLPPFEFSYPTTSVNYNGVDGVVSFTDVDGSSSCGFNYLGNPYSLPLLLPASDYVKSYYYYDGNSNDPHGYVTMAGDVNLTAGSTSGSIVVPSYGAFFVQVKSSLMTFDKPDDFLTAVRLKNDQVVVDPSYIRLSLQDGENYDDVVVRFKDEALLGNDDYDINKLYPPNAFSNAIVSIADTSGVGDYAIQALPSIADLEKGEVLSLPLTIRTILSGEYDMSLSFNNIDDDLKISLFDAQSQTLTSLEGDTISVSLDASSTVSDRYSLQIVGPGVETGSITTSEVSPCKVIVGNDNFEIRLTDATIADVKMYDINGRLVLQGNTQSATVYSTDFYSPGVYIVSVSSENAAAYKQKIIIR